MGGGPDCEGLDSSPCSAGAVAVVVVVVVSLLVSLVGKEGGSMAPFLIAGAPGTANGLGSIESRGMMWSFSLGSSVVVEVMASLSSPLEFLASVALAGNVGTANGMCGGEK